VRASGLVKRYETVCALDGVDIALGAGSVRGLLGPNGAGKTTLLRLLFGLIAPDAGAIELLGRPLHRNDSRALEGVGGFVEDPTFYPYLPGRTNLELLAELDGTAGGAEVDEVLARVGLGERAGDRVNGYSTGMRQRLGIAAALLRRPRLLLLDEPTAGLDPSGVRDMGVLLRELSDDGVAVLISSHQIGEIEGACDAFTVLSRGRVVWDGSAAQLQAQAPGSEYALKTSDDERALAIAAEHRGLRATRSPGGLVALTAQQEPLDQFVLALARAGVAVRRLELRSSPLEAMFFALAGDGEP
jgi:ABC-2 type transport system ATP-binding protein